MADNDPIVENPTYMAHVRYFFDPIDIDHMGKKGIELGTYAGVKKNALPIHTRTATGGDMPPEPERK